MSFPKGFLWGGATAANQYEGGYLSGGRRCMFSRGVLGLWEVVPWEDVKAI